MSLFKRKTRATRKAEARAIKAKAKLEARLAAKNEARRIKADHKAQTNALNAQLKAQRSSDKAALKVAETQLKAVREGKFFSPTESAARSPSPGCSHRSWCHLSTAPPSPRAASSMNVGPIGSASRSARSVSSPGTALHCLRGSPAPSTRCSWWPRRSRRTPRPSSSSPRSPSGSVTCPPLSRPPRTGRAAPARFPCRDCRPARWHRRRLDGPPGPGLTDRPPHSPAPYCTPRDC